MSDDERGYIRESKLRATNDIVIYAERKHDVSWLGRFSCWMNGWLPGGWRLGKRDGRWRFFRPFHQRTSRKQRTF